MASSVLRFAVALLVLTLPAALTPTRAAADAPKRPQRIVSTNYCTDQMLLRLVEPERIASLTWLSWKQGDTPPEYLPVLDRVKQNHGLAEEVLRMEPDLVVGGTFSARFTNQLLQELGHNVYLFEPEKNFDEWYERVLQMGQAVGEPERAEKLVADFRSRLAALQAQIPPGDMPIYASLTVNNQMPGNDTLDAQIVNAGGFRTAGQYVGFSGSRTIPLEQLIQIPVDLISSRNRYENPPTLTSQKLQHPLLRRMQKEARAAINIPARFIVCTTPETLDMVALLVQARKDIDAAKAMKTSATK